MSEHTLQPSCEFPGAPRLEVNTSYEKLSFTKSPIWHYPETSPWVMQVTSITCNLPTCHRKGRDFLRFIPAGRFTGDITHELLFPKDTVWIYIFFSPKTLAFWRGKTCLSHNRLRPTLSSDAMKHFSSSCPAPDAVVLVAARPPRAQRERRDLGSSGDRGHGRL